MAELGHTLALSRDPQDGTAEQIRTEEPHSDSMRAVVVALPELPPAYDVVVDWNMVGFKSTATNIPAKDYLGGVEYVIK
jgi:hypothetical protein